MPIWELPTTSFTPDSSAAVGPGAIDHTTEALKRLVTQFRKPKMQAYIRALCKPMQRIEQALLDVIASRDLENAEGEPLNIIGRIVKQPPRDVTATTYKSLVRARIRANKSSGMGDQVLRIVRLVLTDYDSLDKDGEQNQLRLQARNYGHASYVIRVRLLDLPWDLAEFVVRSFLERVSGTGIYASLSFSVQIDDEHTRYANLFAPRDRVSGAAGAGCGDSVSGGVGGGLSSRIGRSAP